jgi:hypothetical protein
MPVPAGGVTRFRPAYLVNELDPIYQSLKASYPAGYCSSHEGTDLKLYCNTCEVFICWKCAYKGGEHHSHDHQDIAEVDKSVMQALTRAA